MNKKADVGISLKFIIGLVIAIMFIIVLINLFFLEKIGKTLKKFTLKN